MTCRNCGYPVTTQPYYEQVGSEVTQSHETVIMSRGYAAGIRVSGPWVTPVEGDSIEVTLFDVVDISTGMYFYNPTYGYLKITTWTPSSCSVFVENDGVHGSIPPGTSIPDLSIFYVVPKPCCLDDTSTLFPFLAEDFYAPTNGNTREIKVTSTFGLIEGGFVRIGSAIYTLTSIVSSNTIVIQNDGAGFNPGDLISALDSNGDYQYLLTTETVDSCISTNLASTGRIIVCDGGDQKVLDASTVGQAAVVINASTNVVQFGQLLTAGLADEAVTPGKIADVGIGTEWTPIVAPNDFTSLTSYTLDGALYWTFGPFVMVYMSFIAVITGNPLSNITITGLPQSAIYNPSNDIYYPVTVLIGDIPQRSYLFADSAGTDNEVQIHYSPFLTGAVQCAINFFYPFR